MEYILKEKHRGLILTFEGCDYCKKKKQTGKEIMKHVANNQSKLHAKSLSNPGSQVQGQYHRVVYLDVS